MKHPALKTLALATLTAFAFVGTAQAQSILGDSSDHGEILVGESQVNGGPHSAGRPGIAVPATGLATADIIDFQGLVIDDNSAADNTDAHGVTTLNYPAPSPPPGDAPDDHANLGVFHFAKVSNANVWYGEWQATSNVADGTHTVYYVGDTTGTTLPSTGTASYAVQGISNYAGTPLTGTFNADFGAHTLSGSLTGAQTVGISATIASDASFAGTAAMNASGTVATGTSQGRFYGANAAALAGIASFGAANRQYDTAFGGTKN